MRGEVFFLFSFDVANEIQTSRIKEILSKVPLPFVIRMDRSLPKDVPLYRPLALELPPLEATLEGRLVEPSVRVYDVGVVSVILRVAFSVSHPLELMPLHNPILSSGKHLEVSARDICAEVCASLAGVADNLRPPHEPEAYTIFCTTDLGGADDDLPHWYERERADIAALLSETPSDKLSQTQINESLRVRVSFETTDLVVIDWDAAFVVDLSGYVDDVVYVLELANMQLEEFWVMDAQLDKHLNEAYEDMDVQKFRLFGRSRTILKKLRGLKIDFVRLTDEVSHISKFIGDWHLARVYLGARERFHLDEWRASVAQRLAQLDQLYTVVHAEIYERRMLWLELVIVVMFAIDILALFVHKV